MWESIELRELRVFLLLADELHFGRTARRAALTQSRVSQILRSLEQKLGVQLVERTSRRVALTAAGDRFRAEAGAAVAGLDAALRATADSSRLVTEPLRLGVIAAAAVGPRLRAAIDAYEAAHPDSSVQVVGLPFRDRLGPLRRAEVDVVVTTLPLGQPDIVTGPVLSRSPRYLAVARDHPLAEGDEVSIEDLADHAIARLDIIAPSELAEEMAPHRTPAGRRIQRVDLRIQEVSELLMAIARRQVVQPVTATFTSTYGHPDVVYRRIRDLPPTRAALAWRRRDRSPALRAFLKIARETPGQPAG
jgi:DNA-binding transcriptional LysR family regulator